MSAIPTTSQRAGFSLIEVLVAMAILTLGITSAMALFTAATQAHKRAIDRTNAAAIAEQVLADVESALERGVEPLELEQNPPLAEIHKNWPGYDVEIRFFVVEGPTSADEILAEVEVGWRFRGQELREKFQQLIARATLVR